MQNHTLTSKLNLFAELRLVPVYWETFLLLSWRNLRLQYNPAWLGLLWGSIHPLLICGIFYTVLNRQVGAEQQNYFLYIYSGLIFWNVFIGGLSQAYLCFLQYDSLIKTIYFPRFLLPLTFFISRLVDFFVAFLILIALALLSDQNTNWLLFAGLSILSLLNLALVSAGIYWVAAVICVRFRGLQMIYSFIVQALFFTTPIIYSVTNAIESDLIRGILQLNPLAGTLYIFRSGLFVGSVDYLWLCFYTLYSLGIFILGFVWFKLEDASVTDRL